MTFDRFPIIPSYGVHEPALDGGVTRRAKLGDKENGVFEIVLSGSPYSVDAYANGMIVTAMRVSKPTQADLDEYFERKRVERSFSEVDVYEKKRIFREELKRRNFNIRDDFFDQFYDLINDPDLDGDILDIPDEEDGSLPDGSVLTIEIKLLENDVDASFVSFEIDPVVCSQEKDGWHDSIGPGCIHHYVMHYGNGNGQTSLIVNGGKCKFKVNGVLSGCTTRKAYGDLHEGTNHAYVYACRPNSNYTISGDWRFKEVVIN